MLIEEIKKSINYQLSTINNMRKFFNSIIFLFFLFVALATNAPRQVSARDCLPDQFCYWSCEDICAKFPWEKICPCFRPSPTLPPVEPTPTEAPQPTPTEIPGEPIPTEVVPTPTLVTGGNGGEGGPSEPGLPGPPHCGAAVPPAPTLLRVTSAGPDQQELEWTLVEQATHYSVHYGRAPGNYEYGVANVGKTTTFSVGGLDPNTNYCFALRAVNDCAPSELSNEICTGQAGQVLGARTKVLGATSSKEPIKWLMEITGALFLFSGLWLKRKSLVRIFCAFV